MWWARGSWRGWAPGSVVRWSTRRSRPARPRRRPARARPATASRRRSGRRSPGRPTAYTPAPAANTARALTRSLTCRQPARPAWRPRCGRRREQDRQAGRSGQGPPVGVEQLGGPQDEERGGHVAELEQRRRGKCPDQAARRWVGTVGGVRGFLGPLAFVLARGSGSLFGSAPDTVTVPRAPCVGTG